MKEEYLNTLRNAIRKVKRIDYLHNKVNWIVHDISTYLNSQTETEGYTTQSIMGVRYIFRGWIVKN